MNASDPDAVVAILSGDDDDEQVSEETVVNEDEGPEESGPTEGMS